jgi:hypothetical protein
VDRPRRVGEAQMEDRQASEPPAITKAGTRLVTVPRSIPPGEEAEATLDNSFLPCFGALSEPERRDEMTRGWGQIRSSLVPEVGQIRVSHPIRGVRRAVPHAHAYEA